MKKSLILLFLISILLSVANSQSNTKIIIKLETQKIIEPIESHSGQLVEKLKFKFLNNHNRDIYLYGSKNTLGFKPLFYLLEYNESKEQWVYSGNKNEPLEWSKESKLFKKSLKVNSNDSFEFDIFLSTYDIGKKFKVAVFSSCKNGENPFQVISDEFTSIQ